MNNSEINIFIAARYYVSADYIRIYLEGDGQVERVYSILEYRPSEFREGLDKYDIKTDLDLLREVSRQNK